MDVIKGTVFEEVQKAFENKSRPKWLGLDKLDNIEPVGYLDDIELAYYFVWELKEKELRRLIRKGKRKKLSVKEKSEVIKEAYFVDGERGLVSMALVDRIVRRLDLVDYNWDGYSIFFSYGGGIILGKIEHPSLRPGSFAEKTRLH